MQTRLNCKGRRFHNRFQDAVFGANTGNSRSEKNVRLGGLLETGATGLEPATSGVTGVSKPLRLVASSRLNRVAIRLRRELSRS